MVVKTKLFAHQQHAVDKIRDAKHHAVLHSCGLGKTLTTLAVIDHRVSKEPKYRSVVVCPNTLIDNWSEEIRQHTTLTSVALIGSRAKRSRLLETPAHVYLINYEGLRIMVDELMARKFWLVVFDECHALKCPTSQQSKAGFRFAMSVPHRIIMTGTPIMNSPLDAYGQFRCLSPDIFGASYFRFRATYAVMGGFLGKQVVKYIRMDQLKTKLLQHSHIRTKEECLDLPPKLYEVVRVEMPEVQSTMYRRLRDEFIAAYKDAIVTAPVMLTRLIRFSQITAGFYKDIEGKEHSYEKNPKHEWLVEWLKENGQKTIVFVRFIKELHDLEQRLHQEGIRFVSVFGDTRDRIAVVKSYNNDPAIQVFIGQIDTAGQGINLQSAAYCVFLSNSYSFGDREQCESRIHRQGQKALNCTYIDVVARGTIDEKVLRVLKKKESLSQMLTKDVINMIDGDGL